MVGNVGFEPTHQKKQIYSLSQLSNSADYLKVAPSLGTAPSSHGLTDRPHAMCVTRNIIIVYTIFYTSSFNNQVCLLIFLFFIC